MYRWLLPGVAHILEARAIAEQLWSHVSLQRNNQQPCAAHGLWSRDTRRRHLDPTSLLSLCFSKRRARLDKLSSPCGCDASGDGSHGHSKSSLQSPAPIHHNTRHNTPIPDTYQSRSPVRPYSQRVHRCNGHMGTVSRLDDTLHVARGRNRRLNGYTRTPLPE